MLIINRLVTVNDAYALCATLHGGTSQGHLPNSSDG